MSKREIRAKRLVAAVLLAISVQMWSAPPLWAAEASVQTETSAAGEAKETKDAKDAKAADSETGGEADAGEEETVVVPVIGYSTRSAAGSDYGVMPLADMAVDGALTGVTGINGSELVVDKVNNNFFIGTTEYGGFDKKSKNRAVIGLGIYVDPSDNISVFGTSAEGHGESASAFGYNASADEFSSVFGSGANAASNGSVFGYNAEAVEQYANAFGSGAVAGDNHTIAFGYSAKSAGSYSIAVGSEAIVEVARGIAIGAFAHIEKYEGYADSGNIAIGTEAHTNALYSMAIGDCADSTFKNSIAIGASSNTTAENQVSFGTGFINTINGEEVIEWTARRSLAGISDIEMAGVLTGVNKIDMKNGALTGVSTINGNVLVAMNEDVTNKSLAIGTGAAFSSSYSSVTTIYKNAIAIGNGVFAGGDGALAIGFDSNGRAASAGGVGSISLNAMASGDHNVVISGWADAYDSVVIGYGAGTDNSNVVAIGSGSYGGGDGTVLGYAAATDGRNSVAIGAKSYVASGNDNQVSFGHKVGGYNYADGSNFTDDLFRSLINVADIEMHGALTGVTGIDGVTVSGTDASTGLTVGGNAVIGKTDTPFSSTGFAVAKDGAVTAKTVNGATITGTGFNGVTLSTDGKVNGAVITSNSFNGVTLEKGADSHYKVGGVDVTKMQTDVAGKADAATTLTGYGITDAYTKTETDTAIGKKADKATTLTGYGIVDAYTKTETDTAIGKKADKATTLAGYGIADAYTKTETDTSVGKKADKATTLTGYGIADAYTKTETDTAIGKKADKATTLTGYGITDAYTKTAADEKITAATADMATKTQVTADIGTAKTALESAYQAADTALSDRAAALETAATGMSYDAGKNTTTFTGGVTATVLTAGEFKVGATGFGFGNDGALTAKTVNGIEIKKDGAAVKVGGIDLTALSKGDVVTDNTKGIVRNQDTATTTIETNTKISSSGITTNAVTASGTVKASEFVEGDKKLSDKYAAKTALDDYTTTTDMNTKLADYATTTAVDTKLADYAKSDSVYSKAAADTAFAKAGDVDTLKTTVGDADGGLVKDVTELQSGKADNATTLAGYGIADAYTQTEINEKIVEATKDLATSATVTDIQSGLDEVTGKTAGLSYDTASGSSKFSGSVVIGNEGAKTHTQITDDAIIFGEGTDKQVTVDASGIHVGKKAAGGIALYADADGTHIDHTSLVTGSVTADNLNGVAISGNATDGLSVGGVSIKALSERLDSLEQDGVATADMGGIKRTDVVENSGKTIIEDTTSFTKDGLKTANLEAATAALGGVNFAAGAVTGVSSINGVVFGSDGKIGGVSLSGGKVDGVDVGWLDQRVKSLEDNGTGGGGTGGGGSSANTSGIHKPDGDTTNIEGNTSITTDGIDTNKVNASDSIVVADGEKNKTVISKDGILVAEGEKNQVKINEDGIHVGKNSSVVNDTDGFITDKGLYIGVSSSSDTSTAKFSVAPNGNLSSKAGDYGFSNTSADGAKFTHSGDTAYGTGSQLDTTIQGNKVTTGRVDTDELYVDGNKVTVAGGTIGQTDAVDNHLSGTDADGNTVTNDFKTSAVNGTTQAAEKTSADGKESTKTVNNTSAGGTSVTTSRTTTDSKDNVTVKESSFGTNEKGMTLSTSNKVTDKDGKVTKDTSGTTTMTGDSISVSKTTTTTEKDADGNEKEVTKTSGTTIGSGEVTLKREDGSTIEVGSAIEGMQSDMRELDGRVNRMGVEIKEVGALSAALAGLHPQPENANSRADFAMAMGSYEGKQALAVGGFYRPDKRTMLSIGASTTSSKHMMNMGISIALDRLPEAERKAKEAAKAAGVEQETLNRVLERLAALEQDNRRLQADNEKRDVAYEKLAADYTQLKEKFIEETADRQQPEQAEAEE